MAPHSTRFTGHALWSALPSRSPSVAFLLSTSICALAFSSRSQVELGRKFVYNILSWSATGLGLVELGLGYILQFRIGAERFALLVHSIFFTSN